jgi:hypothetical protein
MWLADRASVANIWEIHGPFFSGHELRTGLLSRLGQAEAPWKVLVATGPSCLRRLLYGGSRRDAKDPSNSSTPASPPVTAALLSGKLHSPDPTLSVSLDAAALKLSPSKSIHLYV